MSSLSKRERVDAVLRGALPDRTPVSAWRQFIREEREPEALAAASLKHFQVYDWDWLKINPRATYYAEAWGNRYDYDHYAGPWPKQIGGPLTRPADLDRLRCVHATAGPLGEQLTLVRLIKAGLGDAHCLQTVFSPLAVLATLVGRPERHHADAVAEAQQSGILRYLRENPLGAHFALGSIAATLAQYAAAAVDAGASGVFFAITQLARQGVLSETEYAEFSRPYDLQVLAAVQGATFNLLHVCGPRVYWEAVANYPVHALHWASLGQGNPTLAEARLRTNKVLAGGVDELDTLHTGSPERVGQEAHAAQAAAGGRLLLAPGCALHPKTPAANLQALRRAAERVAV
ncbi:MAG: hypothetical protein KA764_10155 [Anaerolineales bacterium]|nr:hypothetical protein [Anaerolineales bacterium]